MDGERGGHFVTGGDNFPARDRWRSYERVCGTAWATKDRRRTGMTPLKPVRRPREDGPQDVRSLKWHGPTRARRQASRRRLIHERRTLAIWTRPTPEQRTYRRKG